MTRYTQKSFSIGQNTRVMDTKKKEQIWMDRVENFFEINAA
jgi:hypothetical protein